MIKKRSFLLLFGSVLALSMMDCAKRGTPDGGPIDTIPPVITRTLPQNFSTHFDQKEIRVHFNEYIKLNDLQKQLVVSPPLDQAPLITPYSATKDLRIEFLDTLRENTTYSINFGQSIVDNNESNPYDFYKFVFSTGDYIDSLSLSGTIADAVKRQPEERITVMLYAVDEAFTDSVVFNQKPYYVTNTLRNPEAFALENLREGTYLLVAVKDENNDYKFQPKNEKIGFVDGFVHIPTDTSYALTLFKEIPEYALARPKQLSNHHIQFGYEGAVESLDIEPHFDTPAGFRYRLLRDAEKDTLYYWYRPRLEMDTARFLVTHRRVVDTVTVRLTEKETDSLQVKADRTGTFKLDEDFTIGANRPLERVAPALIHIQDVDSLPVSFAHHLDPELNRLTLTFEKEERQDYRITLLPGAVTDFFEETHDTLHFRARTKTLADYGRLTLNLQNVERYPVIAQLVKENSDDTYKEIHVADASEAQDIKFEHIDPGKYYIRLVFDTNGNGRWDTGNFLKRLQPEKIIYYPALLDIRANWNLNETFLLEASR